MLFIRRYFHSRFVAKEKFISFVNVLQYQVVEIQSCSRKRLESVTTETNFPFFRTVNSAL